MSTIARPSLSSPAQALLDELREHALIVQDVELSNGARSSYYVDVKRAIMRPPAFLATGELVAAAAHRLGAKAVGGLTMGADPVALAGIAVPTGSDLVSFLVRKQRKPHGLQRWIEGAKLERGSPCLVVDDVVTTGASTVLAIERVRAEGLHVVGALAVVDRLVGGRETIEQAAEAPFLSLATIDDVYPERPDRG